MKIALLTTSYPRFDGDPSGHFVEAHALELTRAGHRVTVLAMGARAPDSPAPPADALDVRWLRGEGLFGWPGASARLSRAPWRLSLAAAPAARAARALRDHDRFDAVIAHWLVPCGFPLAWSAHTPHLEVWAHGADVRLLCAAPALAQLVVRRLLARDARFVFVARALREALGAAVGPGLSERLLAASEVRPAPIDVPPRAQLVDPRAPDVRGPYVVWVGRMTREKAPEVAARAAREAGVRLVMIGDGPEAPSPSAEVILLGRRPRGEALAWVAHASALVCSSRAEGAPTVVREARALGVPVVTTPCGDVAEIAARDAGVTLVAGEQELASWLRAHAAGG